MSRSGDIHERAFSVVCSTPGTAAIAVGPLGKMALHD